MSKSPNAEQLLAIEHEGGVLLRAGAGSGKTFVLVEHIVFLTQKWITDFKATPKGTFEEYLRIKYSQVVMMTFTRKAAGEMSIRLSERFAEIVASPEKDDSELWKVANECLPLLTVTTIDGFCRKLIAGGHFPHLSTEAKIIFVPERTNQVRELVEGWFNQRMGGISPEIQDIVVREKEDLHRAFTNIFSDPGLRLKWKKFSLTEVDPSQIGKLLQLSFELNDLMGALKDIHALELPHESERSAFESMVARFQATGLPVVDNVDKFKIYDELFQSIKVLRGETAKKKTLLHEAAKEGLTSLREWIQRWAQDLDDYLKHFEVKVLPWMKLCRELFFWIEERLDPNGGMTFGDIEYHVAQGLEDKECRKRIQKIFSYFIVDEFQDTSAVQFQIIEALIGSDFKKLFCVGDAKQAIYGFRGGELSVFQNCAEMVPDVRSLANNYRSLPEVITFNNSLFKKILPLGQDFTGTDPFFVLPEDQMIPPSSESKGAGLIEVFGADLERDLEQEGKFSSEEINRLEASVIAESIERERVARPEDVCTVLYSKLRPSGELIKAVMERKIGFTAQYKIDLLDDPIIGIFLSLLKREFDTNPLTRERYPLFMIQSYMRVLNLPLTVTEDHLKSFELNVHYWGLLEGFRKFLHELRITNENSDLNMELIETISKIYHQDSEAIMIQLQGENQRVSLDLRSGENSHLVQIMSAHASKGLEFDVVYLAGIYTNGKEMHEGAPFGNRPGSFSWYLDLSQRIKRKSPFYIFENELEKYKSFSESKRLFYVACTRAKKKLVWVDFNIPEKTFSIPKNSWVLGMRTWFESESAAGPLEMVTCTQIDHFNCRERLASQTLPELPLFFHDSVGVISKGEGQSELAILGELSVTRLNSLVDCPRKFYLENILKLEGKSPEGLYRMEDYFEDATEETQVLSSTAERGTLIHAQLAREIQEGKSSLQDAPRPIIWVRSMLEKLRPEFNLIAEKPLKFKFFNFMISGTPDLVLLPKGDRNAQLWDFKTGKVTEEKLKHYWTQLLVYSYGLYELGMVKKTMTLELVLCFVDEERNLLKQVTWDQCQDELFPLWRSQNNPWSKNPEHCSQCSYGDICPR